MRPLLSLIVGILLLAGAEAATIHGTVYDLDLGPVKNAIVEIDTAPNQRLVARDGSYSFSVPRGEYRIKATYDLTDGTDLITDETVTVKDDGDYVLDLFLFPGLEEEDEILQDIDMDPTEGVAEEERPSWILYAVIAAIFAIVIVIFFRLLSTLRRRPARPEEKAGEKPAQGDLDKVVGILHKHGGRMTQKDLRKELPLSEAKVSLMVAELEHQGKVKKIRKGRGNILISQ